METKLGLGDQLGTCKTWWDPGSAGLPWSCCLMWIHDWIQPEGKELAITEPSGARMSQKFHITMAFVPLSGYVSWLPLDLRCRCFLTNSLTHSFIPSLTHSLTHPILCIKSYLHAAHHDSTDKPSTFPKLTAEDKIYTGKLVHWWDYFKSQETIWGKTSKHGTGSDWSGRERE